MAINDQQFKKLRDNLIKIIESSLSKEVLESAAKYIIDRIQKRIRLGYGVANEGQPKKKFDNLKPSYVAQRKGEIAFFKKNNKTIPYVPKTKPTLDSTTTAGKSNLTRTGQMIRSISIVSMSKNEITIGFEPSRNDGNNNKEVAGFVSVKRPFFHLSDAEVKAVVDYIAKKLREGL